MNMHCNNPNYISNNILSRLDQSCFALRLLRTSAYAALVAAAMPAAAQTSETAPAAPQSAVAQRAAAPAGDIIVTARRQEERLQDVPIAITAVSGRTIEEQSIVRVQDLSRIAPGFSSAPSARGGSNPAYGIRGMRGATTPTMLVDPAVGVYFAELNLSRGTGTNQSLYDLQSVQVLKGPQGTLFGRNSTGGAVLFEPNRPTDKFEGYVQGTIGNYALRDLEGMINIPINETLALRLSGKSTNRRGYIHDVVNDRYLSGDDARSARAILRWQPSDAITSDFIGTFYKSTPTDTGMKAYLFLPDSVSSSTYGLVRPNLLAALQADFAATQALGKYETRNPRGASGRLYDRAWSIQNNTSFDIGNVGFLGDVTLKNIIGYRDVINRYPPPAFVGLSVDLNTHRDGHIISHQFSEEFQIQGKQGRLSYILGAYYFSEKGGDGNNGVQNLYFISPEFFASATPAQIAYASTRFPQEVRSSNDTHNQSYAGFIHLDFEPLDGLHVAGGYRLTHDKRDSTFFGQAANGANPTQFTCDLVPVTTTTWDPQACAGNIKLSYTRATYDGSISYKFTPDIMGYASYSRGYRAGGMVNRPQRSNPLGQTFLPEYADSYEAGVKSAFSIAGMPARLNVAMFTETFTDLQRSVRYIASNGFTIGATTNASKLKNWGGEVEFSIRPARNLTLFANYAGISPKYKKFEDVETIGGISYPVDVSDSKLAYLPYNQLNAGFSWTAPMGEQMGELILTGNVYVQDGVQVSDINTSNCGRIGTYSNCLNRLSALPGYTLVNARAEWRNVMSKGFDVSVFATNLTNKFYRTYGIPSAGTFGVSAGPIGEPRRIGVSLRVPFGDAAY